MPVWGTDFHHFDTRISRFAQDAVQKVPWWLLAPFWLDLGSILVAFGLNYAPFSVLNCTHFSLHSIASVQALSYVFWLLLTVFWCVLFLFSLHFGPIFVQFQLDLNSISCGHRQHFHSFLVQIGVHFGAQISALAQSWRMYLEHRHNTTVYTTSARKSVYLRNFPIIPSPYSEKSEGQVCQNRPITRTEATEKNQVQKPRATRGNAVPAKSADRTD